MTLEELMEKAKKRANIESDYALAKAMGIDRRVVSDWRNRRKHPSNEECVQLATLAGLDEMQVIAAINLQFATNEKKRDFWKNYIEHRGLTACITLTFAACALLLTPPTTHAESILQNKDYEAAPASFLTKKYTLCVN